MTKLYWVADVGMREAELAFSGTICIGSIVKLTTINNQWAWEIEAVRIGDFIRSSGEAPSRAQAKDDLQYSWSQWLAAAGLS
ncbi:hypothetical protein [Sphingomonas crocodyli]|uniref:Uncharacterized protein n=1 Tax=Sphingomonas crocodyli TaxID=1979270 RepID=A0A437LXW8_9SPHN|nr:hypothetical protein [Sphingomonas crocodyli]RVT90222.1 hypothetical protein EOD43_18160 [Sphingomonas crocodyli]